MAGRKKSSAYELYGFIPKVDNGKHSAICKSCKRVLQNTAAVRMQKHRNSCLAALASGNPAHFSNIEIKRQLPHHLELMQQNESGNSNVKTEQNNIEFEDSNAENTYEDTLDATNSTKRPNKTATHDKKTKTNNDLRKSAEFFNSQQDENPLPSPAIFQHQQQQQPEPFESYHTTTTKAIATDDDDELEEVEDLINIEDELDVIQNLMPRSKESMQLQDELSRVQTEYYRNKAAYFSKLTENSKIKRTLMLLQSRKLQLEIEKYTN